MFPSTLTVVFLLLNVGTIFDNKYASSVDSLSADFDWKTAKRYEFPWLVPIEVYHPNKKTPHHSSATFIGDQWLLTSASSIVSDDETNSVKNSKIIAYFGDFSDQTPGKALHATDIIIHPNFYEARRKNVSDVAKFDFALIKLGESVSPDIYDAPISAVPLPDEQAMCDHSYDKMSSIIDSCSSQSAIALSWRHPVVNSPVIGTSNLQLRPYSHCKNHTFFSPDKLCASSKPDSGKEDEAANQSNPCYDDSGGPLVCMVENDDDENTPSWLVLIGVKRFIAAKCVNHTNYSKSKKFNSDSIYNRVCSVKSWIRSYVPASANKSTSGTNKLTYLLALLALIPVIIVATVAYFYLSRKKRQKHCSTINVLYDQSLFGNRKQSTLKKNDPYALSWGQVTLTNYFLGEGAFGLVILGKMQVGATTTADVAIKMLAQHATDDQRANFDKEASIMRQISEKCGRHVNLVALLGCVTNDGSVSAIVMEYCHLGSLHTFLRTLRGKRPSQIEQLQSLSLSSYYVIPAERTLSQTKLLKTDSNDSTISNRPLLTLLLHYADQICCGMEHLTNHNFVHRDLAVRNVLVSDYDTVKISDFGMARYIYENANYHKVTPGALPIKWMAPEAITGQIYTTASDVWSFGVVMWELATLGLTPYSSTPNENVTALIESGQRLEKPVENCPDDLYELMTSCWAQHAEDRPNFKQLLEKIQTIKSRFT